MAKVLIFYFVGQTFSIMATSGTNNYPQSLFQVVSTGSVPELQELLESIERNEKAKIANTFNLIKETPFLLDIERNGQEMVKYLLKDMDVKVESIDPEWSITAPMPPVVSSKDKCKTEEEKQVPEAKNIKLIPKKAIRFPVSTQVAIIPTDGMFSSNNRRKLLKRFKSGFDSNYEELAKEFDGECQNSVRYFFTIFDDLKEIDNKMVPTAEEIISLVRDDLQSKDLGLNIPLFLEWTAELGKFPEVGGVDYKAMTKVVASLMRGDLPAKLDTASASKLRDVTKLFVKNFGRRDNLPIPDDMSIPEEVGPVALEQRNAILAARRRTTWSDEEMAARNKFLSPDLAQVRECYLSMPCFNPFKFPPK